MTDYDVVVKSIDPEWVMGITEMLGGFDDIGAAHARLWPRSQRVLDESGLDRVPPSIAVERGIGPIEFTAAVPVPDGTRHETQARTFELPGLGRAVATVMHGDDFNSGFRALRSWVEQAGERSAGESREIYLDCDGPRDTWVVELQLALEPRP